MNYLWIIMLIITSSMGAYFAKLSNDGMKYSTLLVFISGMLNVLCWLWVTKVSKNLLFDSFIYDIVLISVFTFGFIVLKCGTSDFNVYNWIGLIVVLIGMVMMKL